MIIDERNLVIVGMADFKVDESPKVFRTNLGSCIAICLFDKRRKVGGLLHYMLPSSEMALKRDVVIKRAKYADLGLNDMLDLLKEKYSVPVSHLEAKIFGGAKVLKMYSVDIGKANIEMAEKLLEEKNIKIIANKTGGDKGYKIDFDLSDGKVLCQVFGTNEEEF